MSMLPSNLARVPTSLSSRIALSSVGRTNAALLNAQNSLSSGRSINRASDDPVRASSILSINDRTQRTTLYRQNLTFADSVLGILDSSGGPLASSLDLVQQARNIASEQINIGSDPSQRSAMAETINSTIRSLFDNVNYQSQGLYLFGGSTPGTPPLIETADGGFRYVGRGSGLISDLGVADRIPITLGGNNALGETSTRQRSTATLSPDITTDTRLADLRGARGSGVTAGSMLMSFNGGPSMTVDLDGAGTIGEVNARLLASIRQYETDNSVTILGPGGITPNGQGISIDVAAGGSLAFLDEPNSFVARDLGLNPSPFTMGTPDGEPLAPRLTLNSPVSSIAGVTPPLDDIRVRFYRPDGTSTSVDVDLGSVTTVDDLRNAIETAAPGVRIEINAAGTGIDVLSELSGRYVAVEDIPGGTPTAQELGLRTFSGETPIAALNFGRGVSIVDGKLNPLTNAYDRALNTDFRITLGNGQYFDVDLRPQDMSSVSTVLARINDEFASQVGTQQNGAAPALAAGDFDARVSAGPNGFAFFSPLAGPIKADTLNNSGATQQMGLTSLSLDSVTGEYIGRDRAAIRLDNLFTGLIELRDALYRNDTSGMTLAGESLTDAENRLITSQAIVGSYSRRVGEHLNRLEDNDLLDKQLLSNLQDTDFTEAAVKLSNLSTQLQATLQTIAQVQGRTLFDFLG